MALAAVELLDERADDVDDEHATLPASANVTRKRDADVAGADDGNVKRLAHPAARLATTRSAA